MTRAREPRWLTRAVGESIHLANLRAHGGAPGIRDEGLLESALGRARHRHGYERQADLARLAAAYLFGLARNHPFVDGNKRVAFMSAYVFLGLNDMELDAEEGEVVVVVEGVARGSIGEEELAAWLRERVSG